MVSFLQNLLSEMKHKVCKLASGRKSKIERNKAPYGRGSYPCERRYCL